MCGGAWDEIKKPLYKTTAEVSRSSAKLGNKIGWDFLEEEGKKNTDNPGRAVGKAAQAVALWYLGGPAWGGAGSAASGAGSAAGAGAGAAGSAALYGAGTTAAELAAEEAAKQAALEMMKQEMAQSAQYAMQQGLLSETPSVGSGLLGGQGGVGMGSQVSLAPGPGVVAPGKQAAAMMDTAAINAGVPKMAPGYWDSAGKLAGMGRKMAVRQGVGLLGGQQQPQAAPPPRSQPQMQDLPPIYGRLTEEQKRKLREQGYNIY